MKKYKVIYLKWLDHTGTDGWLDIKEIEELLPITEVESVGYLIKETDTVYYLSIGVDKMNGDEGSVSTMSILKSCVIKKKIIKLDTP